MVNYDFRGKARISWQEVKMTSSREVEKEGYISVEKEKVESIPVKVKEPEKVEVK